VKSICIVTQSVYETDPRVRRKAEALIAAGYSVDVLALRAPDATKRFTLNGVNVYTAALAKKRGSLARYAFEYTAFLLWAFLRIPFMMRRRHYVAIDVNTLPDVLVFSALGARWMGARVILDMHEITPEFYMSKYGIADTSVVVRILKFLEKISFDFADRVITINEPILELLVGRGLSRAKSLVIMNAVDEARFTQIGRHAAPAGSRTAGFALMYHGTLTPIYGLDIAINAFEIAHPLMPGAELWILGSGTQQQALADQVERQGLGSKVKLIGQVPSREIPGWLSKCDAGVLPIRRDVFLDYAFPNKLPEFIVSGKPVLVSRLKAIRHYFSEDALAFCEPHDPADLARAMVRLYSDSGLRTRLASRARAEYVPIRWELMKRQYVDLVDEMAGKRVQAVRSNSADSAALAG
jgi:glycosyltransferase involved in cell wall biosynthesis